MKNGILLKTTIILLCLSVLLAGCEDIFGSRRGSRSNNNDPEPYTGGVTPGIPSGVYASAQSSSSISVSWNSVSGATSYKVYYEIGMSSDKILAGTVTGTSYTHTGLLANTTYYYYIKAVNSVGESNYSSLVSATTLSSGGSGNLPAAPSGITANKINECSIRVSWNSVSAASGYFVYYSTNSSGSYNKANSSMTYSTSYDVTGLSTGTTYYFKVSSYNYSGEGSQSSYVSETTINPIALTYQEYYSNYLTAGYTTFYRFYANAGWDWFVDWQDLDYHADVSLSSPIADLKVGVRREGSSTYVIPISDSSNGTSENNLHSFYVTSEGYYIIEVTGYSSTSSGNYAIAYF